MNPLIKWPGGKSNEIDKIEELIPEYKRYIEPFFGGGALFFHIKPSEAIINDISSSLIEYYTLIKEQDKQLYDFLMCYDKSFSNLINICTKNYNDILLLFNNFKSETLNKEELVIGIDKFCLSIIKEINSGFNKKLILNHKEFISFINKMSLDKIIRTVKNNDKNPFNDEDLQNNLITGFTSGYYMYFRKIFNDINLNKIKKQSSLPYKAANFYFIREYCYGSMFRYNNKGEFNIPYGGISYNRKNFSTKIHNMFNKNVEDIFKNTNIYCLDFENFFNSIDLTSDDFMFLDPPYDTNFSDYEGNDFTKSDQGRLCNLLKKTPAKFILIIKNTDFIRGLYSSDFNILAFDNKYTYNVRSRNERNVEHLIITNFS